MSASPNISGQHTGPLGPKGEFRQINERPIHWADKKSVVHVCEGADVHPGVRLLWTLCERDVPANAAYLPGDTDTAVDCAKCLASDHHNAATPTIVGAS